MRTFSFCFFLLAMSVRALAATADDEIEAILGYVGSLQNVVIIRNGSEHTPTEAVAHMRRKWSEQLAQVKTAEDFIRLCGSESTVTGSPYLIHYADGREEPTAKALLRELQRMRSRKK